jgi:hypothetical protein
VSSENGRGKEGEACGAGGLTHRVGTKVGKILRILRDLLDSDWLISYERVKTILFVSRFVSETLCLVPERLKQNWKRSLFSLLVHTSMYPLTSEAKAHSHEALLLERPVHQSG